jgi:hypothetical protein
VTPLQLGVLIPQRTVVLPCFIEDFSAGLTPYTTISGNGALFTIGTGTYGATMNIASQNAPTVAQISRSTLVLPLGKYYTGQFMITTFNTDDAGSVTFQAGGVTTFAINPRREAASDPSSRPQVFLDSDSMYLGSGGEIAINTWYQFDCQVVAGAGKSKIKITRISDGVVVIPLTAFPSSHTASTVDTLLFTVDKNGPTCPIQYSNVEACPTEPLYGTGQFNTTNMVSSGFTLSNGNMTGTNISPVFAFYGARISDKTGTILPTITDKRYFEVVVQGPHFVGCQAGFLLNTVDPNVVNPYNAPGAYVAVSWTHGGQPIGHIDNATLVADSAYTTAVNDVIGIAIDGATGKIWYARNNTWLNSGNPAGGTNAAQTISSNQCVPMVSTYNDTTGNSACTIHLGSDLTYDPPNLFKPWNQTN